MRPVVVLALSLLISTATARADFRADCNQGQDPDRTISGCTQAIKQNYRNAITYNKRGLAYAAKREYDRAIADFNEAIRLDPNYAPPYNNRGVAYVAKGEHDRAIVDLNEAIRLNAKSALAYGSRGFAYYAKGQYDRAIDDLSEAIRLDPNFVRAYNGRGLSNEAKGLREVAIADYRRAIELPAEARSNVAGIVGGVREAPNALVVRVTHDEGNASVGRNGGCRYRWRRKVRHSYWLRQSHQPVACLRSTALARTALLPRLCSHTWRSPGSKSISCSEKYGTEYFRTPAGVRSPIYMVRFRANTCSSSTRQCAS